MDNYDAISSIEDLENKLSTVSIPWEDIAPGNISIWFQMFAKSHGCSRDLLLASTLPCVSSLLGGSYVELFDSWKEHSNIFMIALAPSGAGKTPACNIGCVNPVISHLEPKIDASLLVDETSSTGLFNLYASSGKSSNRTIPILCIDEAYTFFNKIFCSSKASTHTSLTMERMCKLFDGDYWYTVKGKGKRVGVQSAKLRCAFTTPRRFLSDLWPKIISSKNGFADRVLIMYVNKEPINMEEMEESNQEMQDSNVKGFSVIYENIYMEHHQDDVKVYKLSISAREAYSKYVKEKDSIKPSQAAGAFDPECNAKIKKTTLRLALTLHILWHRLGRWLESLAGPTPTTIPEETLNMALALHDCFLTFSGLAETCHRVTNVGNTVRVGVSEEDIKSKLMALPGPFCTQKRMYNSFSASNRPSAAHVQECFRSLEQLGLGKIRRVNRSVVFYKTLPTEMEDVENHLGPYDMSLEDYKRLFLNKDELVPSSQWDHLVDEHPKKNALEAYFTAENKVLHS